MNVTIRYPTSWGQQKTELVRLESKVLSIDEFQKIIQNATLIRKNDQIIKYIKFGKLIKLSEMIQQIDFTEIFENESPIFQIYTKNVSDIHKRYYKKLQKIQLQKHKYTSGEEYNNIASRSKTSNILQLQRLHDSNLDLGETLDQGGGAIYDNQVQNKNNQLNSRSRDYDIFRLNSLSEGPLSTYDSPTKDFLDYSSAKNDVISNNVQTSVNSTDRSSVVTLTNKLASNYFENTQGSYSNSNSVRQLSKEEINLLQESFLQEIPEKPALIRGRVHKQVFSFIMSERCLEINPEICSLIFYEKEKDIPKKPKDIYPIKDIEAIQEVTPTIFMNKSYFYIKISYVSEIIIGFKYKSTQTLWLHHLQKAMEYCKYVERKISDYVHQNNYKKLQRSILLTSMIEDPDQMLYLEDKKRITDNPPIQNIQSSILQPITFNNQRIENPKLANKETTTTVFSDKPNTQKQIDIFKLDYIEESKNEDLVSNKSKKSQMNPQYFNDCEKIHLSSFDIIDIIGSGAFGRVFLAQKKNNQNMFYAIKSLKKNQLLNKNYLKYAQTELNILKKCRNPFIINLYASFQTQNYIYMALEYCSGGDLGLILAQKNGMKEKTIKFIIAQVILAIEYLHNMNVVYRDLKPENILLDQDGYIKLADFGLSRENVRENEICKSFCGSPAYISPEQLLKIGATKKTDIYGIGCIMYEMCQGNPPFYHQDLTVLFENIKNQPVQFNENFSPQCKDLLEKMLHKQYEMRPTISEIKSHPYFKKMDWNSFYQRMATVPEEILECIDIHGSVQNNYNYQNATIFKDAEYDLNQPNQKKKIENWSFVQKNIND
ncbi:hypothetical protein ABPG74_015498 [Tetrahymena malaccensis]